MIDFRSRASNAVRREAGISWGIIWAQGGLGLRGDAEKRYRLGVGKLTGNNVSSHAGSGRMWPKETLTDADYRHFDNAKYLARKCPTRLQRLPRALTLFGEQMAPKRPNRLGGPQKRRGNF